MYTYYSLKFKDGTEENGDVPCFNSIKYNMAKSFEKGLTAIGLSGPMAGVYKNKEFMDIIRAAFPKGLINDDGSVNMGYKADLILFALCTMRQPTEFNYQHLLPEFIKEVKEQYAALKDPPFKLSAPLFAALCNFPGDGNKDGTFRPIVLSNSNHCGSCWLSMTFKDLYALAEQEVFDGVQKVLDAKHPSWTIGYSSVSLAEKRNGDYCGGGDISWRKDKNTVYKKFYGKEQPKLYWDEPKPKDTMTPKEAVAKLFQLMVDNKPN